VPSEPAWQTIRYELDDGIATVTLYRPERSNAFTFAMRDELLDVFDRTDGDDDVRAVIVTGSGRAFCVGADLTGGAFASGRYETATAVPHLPRDGGGQVSLRIFASHKPVIGAINGAAVGVGATMSLPMDVRLATPFTKYGFVFVKRGIVPDGAGSWFLPRVVGIGRAVEWGTTGRLISGAELTSSGLVHQLVAPGELLVRARQLAKEFVHDSAGGSVAVTRQLLWRMLGAGHPMVAHVAESRAAAVLEPQDSLAALPEPVFPDEPVSPRYALHLQEEAR
jgi:enoyl-CoA hydratase/carnithine racemase